MGLRGFWFLAGVFLVSLGVLAVLQFQHPDLVSTDSYYHVGAARLYQQHGLLKAFPWAQATVWRDQYTDKDFLFHLLLIPFLGDDAQAGPKWLTVLLGAAILTLMGWVFWRHGLPCPWLWVALLLAGGSGFLFRISLTRPHLLSILLAVLCSHLLVQRKAWAAACVALVFPMCYTAAHLPVGLALLFGVASVMRGERFPWRTLLLVAAGVIAGMLLHPHRDSLFRFWYIMNVRVLATSSQWPDILGSELTPLGAGQWLIRHGLILIPWLVTLGLLLVGGARIRVRTLFLAMVTTAFLILTARHRRFVEYLVPFAVWSFGSSVKDLLEGFDARAWVARHRRLARFVLGLGLCLLFAGLVNTQVRAQAMVAEIEDPFLTEELDWVRAHIPKNQILFATEWESGAYVLRYAPEHRSLVMLEPTLMLAHDADLFALWLRIREGREPDAAERIVKNFGARWVLCEQGAQGWELCRQALADRRFLKVHEGPDASLFAIPAGAMAR